ncbi:MULTISPECIES: hypothetical protein [unclassified Pseudomonas]|uniref:hypothetical protein n=1 Tax=unclassified Pseudomonas TaxID=196821 RepID=UPI0019115218|nr:MULTISPECIES: hypothetical protein [unclassified Pseudomonas]MBK5552906.1 hypothetical protein [Pseudomonas sp. TH03]MEB0224620.1 hypothetical protein [Pseudomonas sp. 5S1]MEB0295158.1 hypothetical protein [Pseudomonas sp. 10S4]WPX16956.1 hypothetical protein RHM58_23850 [Pseudomonas sp. 10S4]
MRRAISITVLSALAGLAQAENTNTFDCNNFMQFGGNIDKTRAEFTQGPETLTWNWFVCLNQPAAANSPDRVWETMKPSDQVYLSNGAAPLPYGKSAPLPSDVLKQAKDQGMDVNRTFHNLNATQQVDGLILEMGGAVPDAEKGQPVRFQLLMGQDTFDYIVQKQVYNMNGQAALTSDLTFPSSAWELKASWLWIGNNPSYQKQLASDGYYIAQAYYQQGNEYLVGYAALSGLHVINKLNPDWVWTTFENRNNSKYTVTNAIPSTPMTNSTGPTPAAQPVNTDFQARYPALAQYELIGTQSQTTPTLLANSQLESAFQSQSSCFACHGTAAYSKKNGYFNFALKEQGGLVYPTAPLPASDFVGYNKLDFVWSLKRAQWQR